MTSVVFITSGIGNALFLVPMVRALKQRGRVVCIAHSPFASQRIFDGFDEPLFDAVIDLSRPVGWVRLLTFFFSPADRAYLDHFASTKRHLSLALLVARRVTTNRFPLDFPAERKKRIDYVAPRAGLHEAEQYLRFADPAATFTLNDVLLKARKTQASVAGPYLTIQPGAGNNQTPWKTWPLAKWCDLMARLHRQYPGIKLVVLGDASEREMKPMLRQLAFPVQDMVDELPMEALPALVAGARLHIGGDSGLLHLAALLGTPAVSIWGGSDPQLAGWSQWSDLHVTVAHPMPCHPCYRWYLPNKSRVEHASKCPDFQCIRGIETDEVFQAIQKHLTAAGRDQ